LDCKVMDRRKRKTQKPGNVSGYRVKGCQRSNYEIRKEIKDGPAKECLFADVAMEWFNTLIKPHKSPNYIRTVEIRLNKYLIPVFGKKQLSSISPSMILLLCRKLEKEGLNDTAQRLRQFMKQIFDYAISTDRIMINPASAIYPGIDTYNELASYDANLYKGRKLMHHLSGLCAPFQAAYSI